MLQSQKLAAQIEQERKEREQILLEQSKFKQQNHQLTEVLTEFKNQASNMAAQGSSLYNLINTKLLDLEALHSKEQQFAKVAKARQANEAKKHEEQEREEEKRKKMLKNLANARKARGK
jgi:hypothetical protein